VIVVVSGKGGNRPIAQDRKTPVAVSTVSITEVVQSNSSWNKRTTRGMKNTPSVYVSKQAGGFWRCSECFIRGFDQRNTAFLLMVNL
jgi:iron complex outermembrane receptor protein